MLDRRVKEKYRTIHMFFIGNRGRMGKQKNICAVVSFIAALFLFSDHVFPQEALDWEKCVKEASKNHPDLSAALYELDQTIEDKEITRSGLLPQIGINAGETTQNASSGSASNSSSGKIRTQYTYELNGQQLLFDGFKTSYDLSTSERNIRASLYNYEVTSSNVRLQLRTAFANLLSAQELLQVTESIAKRRKDNLELVKLRYEGGREHKGSLLTAEADLAQADFEVKQARRSIYATQRQIVKELGRYKYTGPLVAVGSFEVKDAEKEMPDFDGLADTNPFLKELIAKKEAAKFGIESAKAEFFPQVYATGSTGNSYIDWPPGKNQWSIGTALNFSLYEGGSRLANVRRAKSAFMQAGQVERSGRDGVIFTMVETWTALQNALEKVEVQRKFLEATKERARISEAEYAIGMLSFDNWIIIEDNLVSAKKSFLAAEREALIAEANWIQAKGGTLDYDKER